MYNYHTHGHLLIGNQGGAVFTSQACDGIQFLHKQVATYNSVEHLTYMV